MMSDRKPSSWIAADRADQLERENAELRASMATVQAAAKTLVRGADMRAAEAYRKMPDALEAIRTLDSEREANALLTEENEKLRAEVEELKAADRVHLSAGRTRDKRLATAEAKAEELRGLLREAVEYGRPIVADWKGDHEAYGSGQKVGFEILLDRIDAALAGEKEGK
jgi:hypothetical protein